MPSMFVAAGVGGLIVACCWAVREVVLHRRLGTWRADPVTGLPVRRAFYRKAHRAIRRPGTVVLLLDLDRFKPINDHFGHHVGDQVLGAVGSRLRARLGRTATLGRLGGDEFAVVVQVGPVDIPWVDLLEDLVREIRAPITVPGLPQPLSVGVSIGAIHLADLDRPVLSAVLQAADALVYQAKRGGGGLVIAAARPSDTHLHGPVARRPTQRRRHSRTAPAALASHRTPFCRAR